MRQFRGNELRGLREAAGLTGPQAARVCGVPYKTYWAWEKDQNRVADLSWEAIKERLTADK